MKELIETKIKENLLKDYSIEKIEILGILYLWYNKFHNDHSQYYDYINNQEAHYTKEMSKHYETEIEVPKFDILLIDELLDDGFITKNIKYKYDIIINNKGIEKLKDYYKIDNSVDNLSNIIIFQNNINIFNITNSITNNDYGLSEENLSKFKEILTEYQLKKDKPSFLKRLKDELPYSIIEGIIIDIFKIDTIKIILDFLK